MSLGWAIVGTGQHARTRMAPGLAKADGTRLAAVCSRDLNKAREMGQQFGFARAYESYEELLRDASVDVVYLATPNALHAEQTIQAAHAGKHVLCEKPMALSVEDAERMVEACERAGVRLGVGFHIRHHPATRETRRLMAEGELGRVFLFDARFVNANPMRGDWWQDPGMIGAYIMGARGCHALDLLCHLAGRAPRAVTAMTDGQRGDKPLEDTAVATLRFDDDVFATMVATRFGAGAENGFTVYGTAGLVQGMGTFGPLPTGTLRAILVGSTTQVSYQAKDLFQAEAEAFNRAVVERTTPNASGLDGLLSVRVTQAVLESARTGKSVALEG